MKNSSASDYRQGRGLNPGHRIQKKLVYTLYCHEIFALKFSFLQEYSRKTVPE